MHCFQPVSIEESVSGQYQFGGENMMLITAQKGDKVNTMTASWGSFGYIWNRHVVTIYIRESRYTREFLDDADYFSLSFLDYPTYHRELKYLGMVSGRSEDKIKGARFNVNYDGEVPFIDEAKSIILCRKLFRQKMEKDSILLPEIVKENYKNDDYHIIYIAEITKIAIR